MTAQTTCFLSTWVTLNKTRNTQKFWYTSTNGFKVYYSLDSKVTTARMIKVRKKTITIIEKWSVDKFVKQI